MASKTPALTVRKDFPRLDRAVVERFSGAATGHLCDSQNHSGALDYRIKPVTKAAKFFGSAVTVLAGPRDNLAPWAALQFVQPGDVLVLATGGYLGSSVCGDVFVGMARNRGAVAIVTDGLVRDLPGIEATGLPVFARGISPNSPLKNGPGEIGTDIAMGDMTIRTGDVLVGDSDGVVVVPGANALAVLDALEGVRRKEAASDQEVAAGKSLPSWMEATLAEKGMRTIP